MPYTPHTKNDIEKMLSQIGIKDESELFASIPTALRAKSFNIEEGKSEFEVYEEFKAISAKNDTSKVCFLGGGYYDHIIPTAVDALSGRSEFYTAYTPYQAEASQGTLQALYEYQTMICNLTGMEATNASMYDGGTAMAEAALMAVRITRKKKILIDSGVNPIYANIVKTYLAYHDLEVVCLEAKGDKSSMNKSMIDEDVAGYIFQNPNFFGSIEDYSNIINELHEASSLAIMSSYPIALGLIKTPGEIGADIYCGDGQSLGNYLGFGGPSFGILATKEKYIRNLPGRIVGLTDDMNGKRAYVLTLQAREQHIRRDKATSNICSNQNLMALRATIFLSLLGKDGFGKLALQNYNKANYLRDELAKIKNIKIYNQNPTFNEFVVELPMSSEQFLNKMSEKGFFAGLKLDTLYDNFENRVLISVTEKRTKAQIDSFVKSVKEII
ncbi:MAG: aminomethyl-transferring glycine dehydrogenase subunit GcvPA [Sulfurospirillaceae bacterium]|nr:aminomethyl-transferring glycine dehydrogenase subunit GcvPA [Sulfurospirillaceae bacterium]